MLRLMIFGLRALVSLMVPRLRFEGIRSVVILVDDGLSWCAYNHIPLFHDPLGGSAGTAKSFAHFMGCLLGCRELIAQQVKIRGRRQVLLLHNPVSRLRLISST